MTKYRPLSLHLASLKDKEWVADFKEIEAILGFTLPRSAYTYHAWWANQSVPGHAQIGSWRLVGWRTGKLDLVSQKVTFFREDRDVHIPLAGTFSASDTSSTSGTPGGSGSRGHGLTIAEARAGLATYFGVAPEKIEITIKG